MRLTTLVNAPAARGDVYFFAGWGMDERPFAPWCDLWRAEISDVNLHLVSHYGSGEIEPEALATRIGACPSFAVVGWSFGVRAALDVLKRLPDVPDGRALALTCINGTFLPVSRTDGIAPAIARRTLAGLSNESLTSFYENMTLGDRYTFAEPSRTVESLASELAFLIDASLDALDAQDRQSLSVCRIKALISLKDRIIPERSQKRFWEQLRSEGFDVEIQEHDCAHWDADLIREALIDATTHM